jgi:hypothetical protein
MTLQTGVEIFAVIHLTTVGLSHILAHRAWAEFFILLRDKGHAGVIFVGFLSLGFGSIIAAFHPVWTGPHFLLTLLGWSQVLKALVYLSFPSVGLKKLHVVTLERSKLFVAPGIAFLALAAVVLWVLLE